MKSLIGDKKFYQRLIAITVPIILQQLITSSVQLVDNIMVGQLAEIQSNAVFVVNQIYFVLMLITFGVMSGAGIYSAQYHGAKEFDKLRQTFRFKINAGIVVGLLSFMVFTFLQKFLISSFTDENLTIGLGMSYMNTIRWAIVPFILSIAISSTFREIGIVKPLLYISIVAIFTNTALNYVLIFGHLGFDAMGTDGAAIATLIARCVEFMLMVVFLMKKGAVFRTKIIDLFKINKRVLIAIIAVGAPLTLNEFLWSMGQTMFVKAYSERGTNALGAMYITNSVSQLVFVTFGAWATGIAVMVGNTLGENKLDIAKDNAKKLIFTAFVFAVFTGFILFGLSFFIVDIFQFEDITKSWASFNIRVNALFIPLYSLNVAIYFTLRSGGDMRSTVMIDSGFMWVVSVPVALSLAYFTTLPITIMFLLVQSLEVPKSIFGLYRYKKEYWLKNLAINDNLDEKPVNISI